MSILFIDLVGYTQLSEDLDPEDLRVLQGRYQVLATHVIRRFGGFVAQFTGDGVMAYFGYPTAHENDVERAVLAGLELIARLPDLDTRLSDVLLPPLAIRIGLHTGLVLVAPEIGSSGGYELRATGEAVNIAARLQAEAGAGSIIVSEESLAAFADRFDIERLGPRPIRGLSRPLALCRVIRARPAINADDDGNRRAARMVGRDAAFAELEARWTAAQRTQSCHLVTIVGDAGVGKTRLVRDFLAGLDPAAHALIRTGCDELFANAAFYALTTLLWTRAGLVPSDDKDTKIAKVTALLASARLADPANVGLYTSLLGLTEPVFDERSPTPQLYRQRQLVFVLELIADVVTRQPTVLWIDDVQWLDPSTAELLHELVRHFTTAPLLVVLTRRSFPAGPALPPAAATIRLDALGPEDCLRLARGIPGADALPQALIERAVTASEGLPLFIEQFIVSLIEEQQVQSARRRRDGEMPLLLAQMMSERLDRRPGGRRLLQAAACIGRSFGADILGALLDRAPAEITGQLQDLVEAELLVARGPAATPRFEFRHALIQSFAYQSMVQDERRELHDRIVAALARPEFAGPNSGERLAHHLTEARRTPEAISAWLRLGVAAAQNSANLEAIDMLRKALGLLDRLADPAQQRQFEIPLQMALIGPLMVTQGSTSPEVLACCECGLALCEGDGASPASLPFAFGLHTGTFCRGEWDVASAQADKFLAVATACGDVSAQLIGHRMIGRVQLNRGDAHAALASLERSIRDFVPERDTATTQKFGQSHEVHARSVLSLAHFCAGDVDSAFRVGVEAIRSADRLRHPHSTAIPLTYVGGWVFGLCDSADAIETQAQSLIALADEHRMGAFLPMGRGFLGQAACVRGDVVAGEALLAEACAALEGIRFMLSLSGYLAWHADALRRLGRIDAAAATISRSLALIAGGDTVWLLPEARRIAAMIAVAREGAATGLVDLQAAAALARQMQSPVLERRCLMDIAALDGGSTATTAALSALTHVADLPGRIARAFAATP